MIVLIGIIIIIILLILFWPKYEKFTTGPVYTDMFQRLNKMRNLPNVNINIDQFEKALVELNRFLIIYKTARGGRLCKQRNILALRYMTRAKLYLRIMADTNNIQYNNMLHNLMHDLDVYMLEIEDVCRIRSGIRRIDKRDIFNRSIIEEEIIDENGLIEEDIVVEDVNAPVAFNAVPGEVETVDSFLYY